MPFKFSPFTGTFDYYEAAAASGMTAVPLSIASPDTYTVAANTQVAWMDDIDLAGTLDLSGSFIEVN